MRDAVHLSLLLLPLLFAVACTESAPAQPGKITVTQALGREDVSGFARALAPRPFAFPRDHGPHPEFKNEWWYLTGNLTDGDGRRFGFQVTFFRIALTPDAPERASAWATHQVWMGHAALSDVEAGRHLARERFARGALGLAGAQAQPLRVWLENWRLEEAADGAWHLLLDSGEFSLELALNPLRPPLLQGDRGLSQKSAAPGNASYYYSITRLDTKGHIRTDKQDYQVAGLAWLDREWGTSALGAEQAGWDWFSLQLDDGSDVMYYQLRRKDGGVDPHSRGTLLTGDGQRRDLLPRDLVLKPLSWWDGPQGKRYPTEWRMRIPSLGLDLRVRALLPDQLMDLSVRYWEGAVAVVDARSGTPRGHGYLELSGY